jgi:hypothetical protein
MTTGALIFAYNNEQTDYVAMAAWTAQNIRRHLGIPVALVTDRPTDLKFDQVIIQASSSDNGRYFSDYQANVIWHNQTRTNAYELTPWNQTLVLDADYVVASNQLQTVLDSPKEFLAHRWAYDITGLNDFTGLNSFGATHMPMWWATVMMFRRSEHSQLIFETMTMIRDNWTHYRNIYKNSNGTYRNDHALSIALGVVDGHTLDHDGIPWNLASLTPDHKLTQLAPDHYRVDFVNSDLKPRWIELQGQDFHAMGKKTLGDIVANPC